MDCTTSYESLLMRIHSLSQFTGYQTTHPAQRFAGLRDELLQDKARAQQEAKVAEEQRVLAQYQHIPETLKKPVLELNGRSLNGQEFLQLLDELQRREHRQWTAGVGAVGTVGSVIFAALGLGPLLGVSLGILLLGTPAYYRKALDGTGVTHRHFQHLVQGEHNISLENRIISAIGPLAEAGLVRCRSTGSLLTLEFLITPKGREILKQAQDQKAQTLTPLSQEEEAVCMKEASAHPQPKAFSSYTERTATMARALLQPVPFEMNHQISQSGFQFLSAIDQAIKDRSWLSRQLSDTIREDTLLKVLNIKGDGVEETLQKFRTLGLLKSRTKANLIDHNLPDVRRWTLTYDGVETLLNGDPAVTPLEDDVLLEILQMEIRQTERAYRERVQGIETIEQEVARLVRQAKELRTQAQDLATSACEKPESEVSEPGNFKQLRESMEALVEQRILLKEAAFNDALAQKLTEGLAQLRTQWFRWQKEMEDDLEGLLSHKHLIRLKQQNVNTLSLLDELKSLRERQTNGRHQYRQYLQALLSQSRQEYQESEDSLNSPGLKLHQKYEALMASLLSESHGEPAENEQQQSGVSE